MMKVYQLINDWQGLPAGLQVFGPYPILASSGTGYCTQENIPAPGQSASNAFFSSAVEGNSIIFKDVTPPEIKNPT